MRRRHERRRQRDRTRPRQRRRREGPQREPRQQRRISFADDSTAALTCSSMSDGSLGLHLVSDDGHDTDDHCHHDYEHDDDDDLSEITIHENSNSHHHEAGTNQAINDQFFQDCIERADFASAPLSETDQPQQQPQRRQRSSVAVAVDPSQDFSAALGAPLSEQPQHSNLDSNSNHTQHTFSADIVSDDDDVESGMGGSSFHDDHDHDNNHNNVSVTVGQSRHDKLGPDATKNEEDDSSARDRQDEALDIADELVGDDEWVNPWKLVDLAFLGYRALRGAAEEDDDEVGAIVGGYAQDGGGNAAAASGAEGGGGGGGGGGGEAAIQGAPPPPPPPAATGAPIPMPVPGPE